MSETLKEKTAKGLFWGGMSSGIQQLLNLSFGIIIARLLTPGEYGIVGMLTIFSVLAGSLVESGFINALTKKREVENRDYNAVFWFSLFMGFSLYVLLFLCAPLIASFFRHQELIPLSRFLFLGFLFSSTTVVPSAILFKALKAKERSIAQIVALCISGTSGVLMAWTGMSYWGIAAQTVIYTAVYSLIVWYHTSWRPEFSFSIVPIRKMYGFSSKLLVSNIFQHLNANVISVLLGRWFSASDVGVYTQANKWNNMGNFFVTNMINVVAFPVFSSVIDDQERICRIFRKMLRFAAFASFPLMFGLCYVAEELIVITITEKWIEAAKILQLLCIGGAFMPLASLYTNLIIGKGKSNVYMCGTIALGVSQIILLFVVHPYGLRPMVIAFVSLYVLWLSVWHYWVWRLIHLSPLAAIKDIIPFIGIALLSLVVSYVLCAGIENIYLRLLGKILTMALVYGGIMKISNATVFNESIGFIFKKKFS